LRCKISGFIEFWKNKSVRNIVIFTLHQTISRWRNIIGWSKQHATQWVLKLLQTTERGLNGFRVKLVVGGYVAELRARRSRLSFENIFEDTSNKF
jgi:hypothetical protein